MESLFSSETTTKSIERINRLTAESAAVWGKMNVAQMLAHCSETMEVVRAKRRIKRGVLSYLLGGMMKKQFYNDSPFRKNSPTHPSFIMVSEFDLENEKKRLTDHLIAFQQGGEAACTSDPHAFFGNITKAQWGIGMYKHLDHHLQQFGV
jgi:hypothetical protein